MSLKEYRRKRDFAITAEPGPDSGKGKGRAKGSRFVIQKHDASRLHYDFRLEIGGTLVSWAVPKGLPYKKGEKHLAVKVEDHPLAYIDFEGVIPQGQYGGGTVMVWDKGTFEPLTPVKDLDKGKLHFVLHGKKLSGEWYLVRIHGEENQWLVIRGGEDHKPVTKKVDDTSVSSKKSMAQLAESKKVWNSGKKAAQEKPASKPAAKKKAAARVKMPEFIEPMKALSVEHAPKGDWVYEVKFDGFRAVAFKNGDSVRLLSRTNNDLGEKFPDVVEALEKLDAPNSVIDGEIVALNPKGVSSFQLLQAYELGQERPPLYFYAFDLLMENGKSLQDKPLEERKERLQALLSGAEDTLRFSASLGDNAVPLLKKVEKLGLEGLIGKRAKSAYESGRRSGAWVKLKLHRQQEFVIGGYTPPGGARHHFGALLLGVYDNKKLIYCGKVGTGFNDALLRMLHGEMKKLSQEKCPFTDLPEEREGRYGQGITASVMKRCHWVKPMLVCQCKFAEWTNDGRLRQPVFLGLREDKEPKKVVREPGM